jgi:hypothetical protein
MTITRILAAALLIAGIAASHPAAACGYGSGAEIGSNDCTGGATARDRAAMTEIRAGFAGLRGMRQH